LIRVNVLRHTVQNFLVRIRHVVEVVGRRINHVLKKLQGQWWTQRTPTSQRRPYCNRLYFNL